MLEDTQPQIDLHTRMRPKLQRNASAHVFKQRCRTSCCCCIKELRLGWLRSSNRSCRTSALSLRTAAAASRTHEAGAATTFGAATGSKGTNDGDIWRRRHSRSSRVPDRRSRRAAFIASHATRTCCASISSVGRGSKLSYFFPFYLFSRSIASIRPARRCACQQPAP